MGSDKSARSLLRSPSHRALSRNSCLGTDVQTDEQILRFMELHGNSAFHPAGTCKMGRDSLAVVDERLRVRGVERLRVVDASIMPRVTSGNTNAPTMMIGEKAADMIREDAVSRRALSRQGEPSLA